MNTEKYKYFYKYTSTGPTVSKERTFNNENDHFFSVLTLSAGYRRQLSKSMFLTAEPYLKLPLSGVGFGKVKLNSTGVLFTFGITPFNASVKKK